MALKFLDNHFFQKTRILDGGMGQELLNRGVKPHGTLWGASALYNRKYHKTVVKTHLDFIKAGAEIIAVSYTHLTLPTKRIV